MSPWLLLPISLLVLYASLQMLKIVFRGIDLYHERERLSAAEPRRGVAEQAEGTGG